MATRSGAAQSYSTERASDEAAFLDELRRTVSDDGLLMEYLQVTTVGRTRIVPIGGTIRKTIRWFGVGIATINVQR